MIVLKEILGDMEDKIVEEETEMTGIMILIEAKIVKRKDIHKKS